MVTVTLKDVAAQAGVAISTVSLVLNGRGEEMKISAACIKRVVATAEKLGYRSNYHARTLKSGLSKTLGIVKADDSSSILGGPFWSIIAAGIDIEARSRGYNLLLLGAGDGNDPLENTRQAMDERRIDALIALEATHSLPKAIVSHRVPTVVIGERPVRGVTRISFDAEPGLQACLQHLHTLGHRRIFSFGAKRLGKPETPERNQMIQRSASQLGLTLDSAVVEVGPHSPDLSVIIENHRQGLTRFLPLHRQFTAVLCWNDTMALALISLLAESGLRIPHDLSVIGFDDKWATHVVPPLTTVSHSLIEQGQMAVTVALEQLAHRGAKAPARTVSVPSQLIIRKSTAPPSR